MKTVKELRQEGWKVRVSHFRYPTENSNLVPIKEIQNKKGKYLFEPESHGGKIVVECKSPDGKEYRGESVCSRKDQFCKKYGRDLAMLKAFGPDVEPRFKVGDKFWGLNLFGYTAVEHEISDVKINIDHLKPEWKVDYFYKLDGDYELQIFHGPSATKQELLDSL